jgi:hypothetical protein
MPNCTCAHNKDGSTTTILCPIHADTDPCLTVARVTGQRRKGTVRSGRCTNCGWLAPRRRPKLPKPSTRFEVRPCRNVGEGWDILDHERKRAIPFSSRESAEIVLATFIDFPERWDEYLSNDWCYKAQNV